MAGSQEQQAADLTKKKKKKGRVPQEIRVDLSCCKYEILRIVIKKLGWEEANDGDNKPWHLLWTDTSIGPERLMMLKQGQKVNHFVGMFQICRKKRLARNLCAMKKRFPAVYKFFPRAFILPTQLPRFLAIFNSPKPRTYILKPDNGCQGRGVVLVQSIAEVKLALKGFPEANFVAQKYLAKPMLLNGYKFDLRIYALIASCDPLKLFLYRVLMRFGADNRVFFEQGRNQEKHGHSFGVLHGSKDPAMAMALQRGGSILHSSGILAPYLPY